MIPSGVQVHAHFGQNADNHDRLSTLILIKSRDSQPVGRMQPFDLFHAAHVLSYCVTLYDEKYLQYLISENMI
jgi:hypothetical protein